ncbi:MAG TPA: helix-turn-helix transcriptional regulator [Streptosporangiaceae bacterium]|nr:helix-turn-helix transcriptional regulator [Streptosporangiaceae bacterium]
MQNLVRALMRRVSELTEPPLDARGGSLLDYTERGLRCVLISTGPGGHESLSPRENEIAGMVALGHTNRAIGSKLDISTYTVSAHMRRIFTKLGVNTRAEMIAVLSRHPHLRLIENTVHPRIDRCRMAIDNA